MFQNNLFRAATLLSLVILWLGVSPPQKASPEEPRRRGIVFAGLSGSSPKFIDAGPDKGYGWAEYETFEIRKQLSDVGFDIQQEWMTPARIAHEFKAGSPICTYPVLWQNPESHLMSSNRIYSIPKRLEGDQTRKILFNKDDLPKFKRHMDSKGDLDIDSLLGDPTLKTFLIQDFDYGNLGIKLLEENSRGELEVKPAYRDRVIMRVIREGQQLIEMLAAKRFDYLFLESANAKDFKSAKISRDYFFEAGFQTSRIGQGIRDPKLTLVSVACSKHPFTIQAMPHINQVISKTRDYSSIQKKLEYRSRIDDGFQNLGGSNSVTTQFRGKFESGDADYWYPIQQKLVPDLFLFPQTAPETTPPLSSIPLSNQTLFWRAVQESPGALTLLNQSHLDYRNPKKNPAGRFFASFLHDKSMIVRYLSAEEKKLYFGNERQLGPGSPSLRDAIKNAPTSIEKLTLFADGLAAADLDFLRPLLNSSPRFREIKVFFAGPSATAFIVSILPSQTQKITLVSSNLREAPIQDKIKSPLLTSLHLVGSQISRSQMSQIIANLPPSLEELSLSFHRGIFTRRTSEALGAKALPALKYLDLENCSLYDDHLSRFLKAIPRTIKTLRLGNNMFFPPGVRALLSKRFLGLEELDLSNSIIISRHSPEITFPSTLKRLFLYEGNLNTEGIERIRWPTKLEILDISKTPGAISGDSCSDDSLAMLLKHLASRVEFLDLSGHKLGAKTLDSLIKTPEGKTRTISDLSLAQCNLGDEEAIRLSQEDLSLQHLDISSNRIHNRGITILGKKLGPSLVSLNIGGNLISEEGTRALAQIEFPRLESLSLGDLPAIDWSALGKWLPARLKKLEATGLSNRDLITLAAALPKTLIELRLVNSQFEDSGSFSLASRLPPTLKALWLDGTSMKSEGLKALLRKLPASLTILRLGSIEFDPAAIELASQRVPLGLNSLVLGRVNVKGGTDLAPLFAKLPRSLTHLNLVGTQLSLDASKALAANWPVQLRQLFLNGVNLGDEKAMILAKALPPTIERLAMIGADIGDETVKALAGVSLDHLHSIEWSDNHFTHAGLIPFFKTHPAPMRVDVSMNSHLSNDFFAPSSDESMETLRTLDLRGTALTATSLAQILKRLSENIFVIVLDSVKISKDDIGVLLRVLPKGLVLLSLKGNDIGEEGRKQVLEYAKQREVDGEIPLQIIN